MFVFANRRDEIRKLFIKNVLGILRPPPASRTVQGVDRLIFVRRNRASRLNNRLAGEWLLDPCPR